MAAAMVVSVAGALALALPAAAFDGDSAGATINSVRSLYGEPALTLRSYASIPADFFELDSSADAPGAEVALTRWPELAATLLDPRVVAFGFTPGPNNGVRARFLSGDGAGPTALIRPSIYDPASPLGLTFVSPQPLTGPVTLDERRGGAWVRLPVRGKTVPMSGGAQLVQVDTSGYEGLRLAYATSYRLDLGGTTIRFRTVPVPANLTARSWRFGFNMTPAARAEWLTATSRLSLLARHTLDQIDGFVTVSLQGCSRYSSCASWIDVPLSYTVSLTGYDFRGADVTRFVGLHELGHIVDFLGLDDQGYAAFRALFKQSPSWRSCFRDSSEKSGCVSFDEIFADQFAFWATGFTSDPDGGYGDPPLAAAVDFGRVLAAQFAFRPPIWRNPVWR